MYLTANNFTWFIFFLQAIQKSNPNVSTLPTTLPVYSTNYKTTSSSIKTSSINTKNNSLITSSKSISSKSSGSPKTGAATDLTRSKDRQKLSKGSIFSNRDNRKGSPTQQGRDELDGERPYKLGPPKMDTYGTSAPLVMEGMMKQFDKNFQIPKLSARSTDDRKVSKSEGINNVNRTVDAAKMFDLMTKNDVSLSKYPLSLPTSKGYENSIETKIRNSMNTVNSTISLTTNTSPKVNQNESNSSDNFDEKRRDFPQNLSTAASLGKDETYKINYTKCYSQSGNEPLSLLTKNIDLTSKFIAPPPKDDRKEKMAKSDHDGLIDYSNVKNDGKIILLRSDAIPISSSMGFPPLSPSVSVHIVKSPAQSPLINPSPNSASPCITDDELMDEALVGIGK